MTQNALNKTSSRFTVDPLAASDSYIQFNEETVAKWRIGNDETDDNYKISQGNALGTNDCVVLYSTGEVTLPLTPAFLATTDAGTAQDNVTGAGTLYNILYPTEIYDVSGDYNAGTSIFTAPTFGKYLICCSVSLAALDANATSGILVVLSSNRDYNLLGCNMGNIRDVGDDLQISAAVIVDMDAADTTKPRIIIYNMGGDTVDINVASTDSCRFTGFLLG